MATQTISLSDGVGFLAATQKQPVTLFVGSAISLMAPTRACSVDDVRASIFAELQDDLSANPALHIAVQETLKDPHISARLNGAPFESLWERVAHCTGRDFVTQLLQSLYGGALPNANHEAIAWLLAQGYIGSVLTTNFDEYIETSVIGSGHTYTPLIGGDALAQVCRWDRSGSAHLSAPLFKIHGTLSIPQSMAFMFPQVATGMRKETRAKLAQELRRGLVVFAGYGANDWDLLDLFETPVANVLWTDRVKDWEQVDERIKFVCQKWKKVLYCKNNLKCSDESILVRWAVALGWRPETLHAAQNENAKLSTFFGLLPLTKRLEILAQLLESLAVGVAADVFLEVARRTKDRKRKSRLEIFSFISRGHGGNLLCAISQGEQLLPFHKSYVGHSWEDLAISTQLSFLYLLSGRYLPSLKTMFRTWRLAWPRRQDVTLIAARPRGEWSEDEWFKAWAYWKAYHVLAHNLVRIGWFHSPGLIGKVAAVIRWLGMRWFTARIANACLTECEPIAVVLAAMYDMAGNKRETAHVRLLLGDAETARKMATQSEQMWAWGRWYQLQANGLRSLGWICLWEKRDAEAQEYFQKAHALAASYGGAGGEMLQDKIKATLELKRLAVIYGWPRASQNKLHSLLHEEELMTDIERFKSLSPDSYSRFLLLAKKPPKTRVPLG